MLDTDASNYGVGAVLSQKLDNGEERVIAYASNKHTKTEEKYCTTRKELLAVVKYLRVFKHYFLGKLFILRTNHKSLTWLLNWKEPSSSQYFEWIEEIMQFSFKIEHRKGELHANADALSRLPQCQQCDVLHEYPRKERGAFIREISSCSEVEKIKLYMDGKCSRSEIDKLKLAKHLLHLQIENETLIYNRNGEKLRVLEEEEGKKLGKNTINFLGMLVYQKFTTHLEHLTFGLV